MELENLKRLIPSLELENVNSPDLVIMLDGVYEGFRFKDRETPLLSDDGSREYVQQFGKVILYDYPGYQNKKRQRYIDIAVEHMCDVVIIIDADEYIHPDFRDWKYFRQRLMQFIKRFDPHKKGIIFNMSMFTDKDYEKAHNVINTDSWSVFPRIWYRPETMEYYGGVHYWVRHRGNNTNERLGSTPTTIYEAVRLVTDSKRRSREFLDARDEWAGWGMAKEAELQKIWEEFKGRPPANTYTGGVVLNPLVCILQPRDIPEFTKAVKTHLPFVDKLWIKYYDAVQAYEIMRKTFLLRNEYSYLAILPDDLIVTREQYIMLYNDLVANDYTVLSGWCNLDTTEEHNKLSNICIDTLPPTPPHASTLDKFKFADVFELDDLQKEGWRIIPVKFAGFPLTFIRRDVVAKVPFRDDFGCCHDSTFALDLEEKGIEQFVDLRIAMTHLKLKEGDYEKMQVGIKKPETRLEFRTVL
jgi:hypothetical protein